MHPNERRNRQQPSLIFMKSMGNDQSAIRTWPCACARMCRKLITQLANYGCPSMFFLPFFQMPPSQVTK